jgi:hypothetical protein
MTSSVLPSRMRAQLVTGPPAESVEAVVERLLAVQAQDLRGARLAMRIRSRGVTAADFDAALTERRSVIVAWLNRGTLHLVPSADYWWLRTLTVPRLVTANRLRLAQEGVGPAEAERGVAVVAEEVSAGPRSRAELKAALDEIGIRTAGPALVHLIVAASIAIPMVRGPLRAGSHCFVDARDWLGTQSEEFEPDQVARNNEGLFDLAGREPSSVLPPPSLAGPFDPLLHGWSSNAEILAGHAGIVTTNGLFRPFALLDGRAVATWRLVDSRIIIYPLQELSSANRESLTADAAAVLEYLRLPAVSASFTC